MKEKKKINKKDIIDKILLGIIALVCAFVSIFGLAKGSKPNTLDNTPKTSIKSLHPDTSGNLVTDNILTDTMISTQTINGITITNLGNNRYSFVGTSTDIINYELFCSIPTQVDKYYCFGVYDVNGSFDLQGQTILGYKMYRNSSRLYTISSSKTSVQCKLSSNESGLCLLLGTDTTINYTFQLRFYESDIFNTYPTLEQNIYYSQENYNTYGNTKYDNGILDANKSFADSGTFSLTNKISSVRLKLYNLYFGDTYNYDLALDYYEDIGGDTDRNDIAFMVYNSNRGTIEIDMLKACRYALWQYTLGQHSYLRTVYGQIVPGTWGYYINTKTTNILSDYFALLSNDDYFYSQLEFTFNSDYIIQDLQCFYINTFAYDMKARFVNGNSANYYNMVRNSTYSQLNLINEVAGDSDMPDVITNEFILFNPTNAGWNISQLSTNSNIVFSMNYNIVGSQYRNGYEKGYSLGYTQGGSDTILNNYDNQTKEQLEQNAVANYINENSEPINLGSIMENIFEYPYKLVKDGLDVDVMGINLASVCVFIIGAFLTIFIVKKVLK